MPNLTVGLEAVRGRTNVTPLETTIATLAKSKNEAATRTLIAALSSAAQPIVEGAVRGLVERRSKIGHQAVIAKWPGMPDSQREALHGGRGRMAVALHEALASDDAVTFQSACEITETIDEFDMMPTLVVVAEGADEARSQRALGILSHLTAHLERMSHASRDSRDRQNTDLIRQSVLECLQRSVERFRQHRRQELIEFFVLLAGPDNKELLALLGAPHHPCFAVVADILGRSIHPAVTRLVIELAMCPDSPQVVRTVAGKRTDPEFTAALVGQPFDWESPHTEKSLGRLKALACLCGGAFKCADWSVREQTAAVRILAACDVSDEDKLDLFDEVLLHGEPEARVAACQALIPLRGQRASELALRSADDADPRVQAAAIGQLRQRHIASALQKLLERVDSPHAEVAQAAREALPEFTVDGLLGRIEALEEDERRSAGAITAKVDLGAVEKLRSELDNPNPRRRLRASLGLDATGLAPRAADALVERLADEDHTVRAAAAEALRSCTSLDVRDALLEALGDRSGLVRTAAQNSLDYMERPRTPATR